MFRPMLGAVVACSLITACSSLENKNTAMGTGIGAGVGAVAGAVIGHQSGNRQTGALLGAMVGGATGGVVGNRMDKQAKELQKIAETKRTEQGMITKLKSDILFDTGKYALKPAALNNLAEMAGIMKKYPENILTIRGYTDSTGSPDGNKRLSEARATAVREEIIKGGIPSNTVSVVGMGRDNPIGDNATADGRAQNRRVEIEIRAEERKPATATKN